MPLGWIVPFEPTKHLVRFGVAIGVLPINNLFTELEAESTESCECLRCQGASPTRRRDLLSREDEFLRNRGRWLPC